MNAVDVIPQWIQRPDLFQSMKIEAVPTPDAAIVAKEEKAGLDFVERDFALIHLARHRVDGLPRRTSDHLRVHRGVKDYLWVLCIANGRS